MLLIEWGLNFLVPNATSCINLVNLGGFKSLIPVIYLNKVIKGAGNKSFYRKILQCLNIHSLNFLSTNGLIDLNLISSIKFDLWHIGSIFYNAICEF